MIGNHRADLSSYKYDKPVGPSAESDSGGITAIEVTFAMKSLWGLLHAVFIGFCSTPDLPPVFVAPSVGLTCYYPITGHSAQVPIATTEGHLWDLAIGRHGTPLLYVYDGKPEGIYAYDPSTGKSRLLLKDSQACWPALSPDRRFVAFSRQGSIVVFDIKNRTQKIMTPPYGWGEPHHHLFGDILPDWSPNGKSIVFTRAHDTGASHLWTVNTITGKTKQITFDRLSTHSSRWSPNGRYLAYIRNTNRPPKSKMTVGDIGEGQLVILDILLRKPIVLGNVITQERVCWSPQSKSCVVMTLKPEGSSALKIVQVDGTVQNVDRGWRIQAGQSFAVSYR
jgi:dipeptidyl aminopeptidase/acylaminoacyl peptidase